MAETKAVRVEAKLHTRLKIVAARNGLTIQELINTFLAEAMKGKP